MFYKPRAMALFTGRPGLLAPDDSTVDLQRMMLETGTRYVAVRRNDRVDSLAWRPASPLRPVFANNTFVLYRNDAVPPAPTAASPRCPVVPSTG
jgi:hypothetical protein